MSKAKWYLKQLLPLEYHSHYGENGKRFCSRFRMWFGVCFSEDRVEILEGQKIKGCHGPALWV
jgi:hypothetical protein